MLVTVICQCLQTIHVTNVKYALLNIPASLFYLLDKGLFYDIPLHSRSFLPLL